jgi:hypothetical protein
VETLGLWSGGFGVRLLETVVLATMREKTIRYELLVEV